MTGEEGLAKATAEKPDLILLDIILPRMSGIEVSQRLKDLEERCKAFGVAGCLVKPYTMAELFEKIAAVFATEHVPPT